MDCQPDGSLATFDMIYECQPTKYGTPRAKVAMLTFLLSGRAQEWAAAVYNTKPLICNDYTQFAYEMKKTFVSRQTSSLTLSHPTPDQARCPFRGTLISHHFCTLFTTHFRLPLASIASPPHLMVGLLSGSQTCDMLHKVLCPRAH